MEGEKDKGNMELKTNEDGKTIIDVLPIGDTVRLQIIAKGFQTYGEDYKIDKAQMAIEIRMKRPGEQYSDLQGTRMEQWTRQESGWRQAGATCRRCAGTAKPDGSQSSPTLSPAAPQPK